jgi:hypothetical protein
MSAIPDAAPDPATASRTGQPRAGSPGALARRAETG